jgi:chromosome condensin MukBEF ATPase and DNA-binding subunit MukB
VWSTEDYVFLEGKIPRTPSCDEEITLLSSHNASLEAKHKDAHDALNHIRGSLKQQRQEDPARFDNDLATLQQSLREAKLRATQLQDNFTTTQSIRVCCPQRRS